VFTQTLNPIGNLWLTVLVALMPVVVLLFLLAVVRMTAWLATIIVSVLAIPLCVLAWHAPLHDIMKSFLFGGLTGYGPSTGLRFGDCSSEQPCCLLSVRTAEGDIAR
jgi:L-lactate permease